MKKGDLSQKVLNFSIYLIYQALRIFFGGSWEKSDLIIALLILNLTWTANLQRQLSYHLGEHKGHADK